MGKPIGIIVDFSTETLKVKESTDCCISGPERRKKNLANLDYNIQHYIFQHRGRNHRLPR
jgi:hypothetical protein